MTMVGCECLKGEGGRTAVAWDEGVRFLKGVANGHAWVGWPVDPPHDLQGLCCSLQRISQQPPEDGARTDHLTPA